MKPSLVILAAGIGSRYGSLKQMEHFGPAGETITDYSIFDALNSGFGKIIFVISPTMEEEFVNSFIKKFPTEININYVIQEISNIPKGFNAPLERKKPWGTAHAVLMAKPKINEPFAVINADDFYGRGSFQVLSEYLSTIKEDKIYEYVMVGFPIRKTLSHFGSVSRGVCQVDKNDYLEEIIERVKVVDKDNKIVYIENDIEVPLNDETIVSMNLFAFTPSVFNWLEKYFVEFLRQNISDLKGEFFIPLVVDRMIKEGLARMKVLKTNEQWFGVTYKEDRPHVQNMINYLIDKGVYTSDLWHNYGK